MKVTFVLPVADMSGGIRVVRIYAEKLQARGHDVSVYSVTPTPLSWRERLRWWRGNVPEWRVPPARSHLDDSSVRHVRLPHAGPVTADDLPDADVVIATWWETAEWVAALPASKGAKAYFLQGYEGLDWMPLERVEATWRLPLHKIVIAEWLVKLAAERFGDPHVSLVPNSVDQTQFFAAPRGKQARPTVGLVYSRMPVKGVDVSLAAFAAARATVPDLRLVAFGTSPPIPELPLPEGTSYHRLPRQDALRELYAQCDAWLFASRLDGFGLPILEAMACRTPVLATPAGAAPELLAPGGGILVPQEDAAALAEAIVRVAQMDGAAWRALSDRAWLTAMGYTWDDAAERFERALLTAIEAEPAAVGR